MNAHKRNPKASLHTILTMPVIYVIPVSFLMRGLHIPVPDSIYAPINHISDAFIATALITLGVQFGSMTWKLRLSDVFLSNVLRLLIGPAMGFVIIWLMGILESWHRPWFSPARCLLRSAACCLP